MHSATTATGRPLPPPGASLPNNRPAPVSCRAARQLAAAKPHVTSQLQCYIPALIDNRRRSQRQFNRQPVRLEFAISPTKQTPAPQFNRQQIATSRFTTHSSRNACAPRIAAALLDTNGRFLRNNNSRNSFKTNDRVNSYSIQTATLAAKCTTAGSVSNRQSQILEIAVNLSKQTIAPRSNRHKNAFIKYQKSGVAVPPAANFTYSPEAGWCGPTRLGRCSLRSRRGCRRLPGRLWCDRRIRFWLSGLRRRLRPRVRSAILPWFRL